MPIPMFRSFAICSCLLIVGVTSVSSQITTFDVHFGNSFGDYLFQIPVDYYSNSYTTQNNFDIDFMEGGTLGLWADGIDSMVFSYNVPEAIPGSGIADVDGNYYETVILSNGMEWMAENLKTTKYSNGDTIWNAKTITEWNALLPSEGKWCHYNNDSALNGVYGKMYNWHAATDSRNVCPIGWHVPNLTETQVLTARYGGPAGATLRLMEQGFWPSLVGLPTNISLFSARPGGRRDYDGVFWNVGTHGYWWTSTQTNNYDARLFYIWENYWVGNLSDFKKVGASIRCVKD